jgi:hypothetical protein
VSKKRGKKDNEIVTETNKKQTNEKRSGTTGTGSGMLSRSILKKIKIELQIK